MTRDPSDENNKNKDDYETQAWNIHIWPQNAVDFIEEPIEYISRNSYSRENDHALDKIAKDLFYS